MWEEKSSPISGRNISLRERGGENARSGQLEYLLPERAIFAQDVFSGNRLGNPAGHAHLFAEENNQLICFEDGVAVLVEHDKLVAVFRPHLLPE
jgi:hypothetical protein